jgi:hypothetical protein
LKLSTKSVRAEKQAAKVLARISFGNVAANSKTTRAPLKVFLA